MARPQRNTIDYFPHYISDGKKMFFIEQKYGNDGYATWFKLLEMLGATEYHFLNLNNESDLMYVSAKCRVKEEVLISIIADLCKLGELNLSAWNNKIIWSDKFIESIRDAYSRRNNKCMTFDGLCSHLIGLGITLTELTTIKSDGNTQSIVKDTIADNSISKNSIEKGKQKRFTPPTPKEILNYFFEKLNNEEVAKTEAEKFFNHYKANGWLVGKNKMKDWKAASNGWVSRMKTYGTSADGKNNIPTEPSIQWINTSGKDAQLYQVACKVWRENGFENVQPQGSTKRIWRKKQNERERP